MSAYSGVISRYIGIAKKKKKGVQGFLKRLHVTAGATVHQQFSLAIRGNFFTT